MTICVGIALGELGFAFARADDFDVPGEGVYLPRGAMEIIVCGMREYNDERFGTLFYKIAQNKRLRRELYDSEIKTENGSAGNLKIYINNIKNDYTDETDRLFFERFTALSMLLDTADISGYKEIESALINFSESAKAYFKNRNEIKGEIGERTEINRDVAVALLIDELVTAAGEQRSTEAAFPLVKQIVSFKPEFAGVMKMFVSEYVVGQKAVLGS